MKSYAAYLFDFDYTLVNSEKGIVLCFHKTFDAEGLRQPDDAAIKRTIGLPMEDAIEALTGIHERPRLRELHTHYRRIADRYMTENTFFYPDAVRVLRALRAHGAKLGIISSKNRPRIREKFTADHLEGLVDLIIGCEEVKDPKPAPEGILLACRTFGLSKADVLYLGDSVVDAGAAQNAGVDFAAVTTGVTPAEAFAPYPHVAILKSLSGLLPAEG